MPGPLDLILPARVIARALDDLHDIAVAARRLPEVESRLTERIDALETQASRIRELGERVSAQMENGIAAAQRLGDQGDRIVEQGGRLTAQGEQILRQGEVLAMRAAEVSSEGARLAEALPTLQRAIEIVEPLQGTVERLGRIADRLPGGRRGA